MAELSDDIRALVQRGIAPVTFEEISGRRRRPWPPRRRTVARVASVAVLVAVAVPLVLAVSHARSTTTAGHGQARHRVIAALDATIASGSFDMTFDQQPVTAPTTPNATTTLPCSSVPASSPSATQEPGWVCSYTDQQPGLAIAGQGTIDTDPFAMVATSAVPGLGTITARDNGTDVWELGGGNYGLSPGSHDSGPGALLSGFGNLVEGTLGPRQGALDMMGLASPTGYLELDQSSITSADQIGTGTVDGVPVTVYQVTLDIAQDASVPGTNAVQNTAIADAIGVLKAQGYTETTVQVSIDAGGYVRRTVSTAAFSDGATQTSETTFSDFGCAGTVLMPGQQGTTSPPAGCVSPDPADTTQATTSSFRGRVQISGESA